MKTTIENKPVEKPLPLTTAQLAESLIISVGEARKILGVDAQRLTDDELANQILTLADLAPDLLNYKHFAK